MKSVLLSTRPKWCEKICHEIGTDKNGKPIYEKSIEVRKTKPSIPTPFKVLLYCTSSNVHDCLLVGGQSVSLTYAINYKSAIPVGCEIGNGKVIGEFVCDKVYEAIPDYNPKLQKFFNYDFYDDNGYRLNDCLTDREKQLYCKGKTLYGWHISDLKIYDTPKELSEFFAKCRISDKKCRLCNNCFEREDSYGRYYAVKKLTRPPQSWMYVQE